MTAAVFSRWARGMAGLALALALAAIVPSEAAPTPRQPTVLLIFSLRNTAPGTQEMESAFRRALGRGSGTPVDLHLEYLDLPDASAVPYGQKLTALLREKYRNRQFDVVVVEGAESLRLLLQNRETLFPGVPIAFWGVSRKAFEDMPPPKDTTGIFNVLAGQRTVSVALDLHPKARRVVLVGGSSPSDRAFEAYARRLVEERAPGMETLSLSGLPLDEQLRRLAELPADSVVIFVSYRADSLGRSMVSGEVVGRVARASAVPVYGASETWLGSGILGGDMEVLGSNAEEIANITLRILGGEGPASIPTIEKPSSRVLMFDWRQLQRWGIAEDRLPAGSVVLFREKTLWSEYRGRVLGAIFLILLQALLIAALLVERRNRVRAELRIKEAERRYRTVADFTYDWEYWKRPDGSFEYVSPSCVRATGYEASAFDQRPALLDELVVEEDRALWKVHAEGSRAEMGPSSLEFRVRSADGQIRWIDHRCAPVNGRDGRFLGVRGSNRDITERKLSEEALRGALAEIERLRQQLESDNTYLREQVEPEQGFEGIIGRSDVLRYVMSRARQVAPTTSTVLLQGETGVGKDLVAYAIHNLGSRRARPLVKLNCAALPASLVESELFGHEKGAFTGAAALRKGRFEIANGSTLFLDEVGELPLELQAKLLRVIQDGEFERVGGSVTLKTDVRLVAATNRRLDEEVKAGRFREDLWYRLNVFPITMPPLRERREDIPLLVQHFVEKHCLKMGRPLLQVSRSTLLELQAQDWPGNVRELEAVVERAIITSSGPTLRIGDERKAARSRAAAPIEADAPGALPIAGPPSGSGAKTLADLEHDHIVATLEQTYWRLEGEGGASALLGMNPSTLRSRMRKHGIRRPGTRPPEGPG